MVIQHNILAMYGNHMLGKSSGAARKSTEKLSSGYKINRAGDNAAGLAISEKMRGQIRGLQQAINNIEDGISLIQVADSALNENHAILQRMRELTIQAANDTNTTDDRNAIQMEINQSIQEIDRIANTTCFNDTIHPLKSADKLNNENGLSEKKLPPYLKITDFTMVNTTGTQVTWDGIIYNNGETFKGTYLLYDASLDKDSTWPKQYSVCKITGGCSDVRAAQPNILNIAKNYGGYSITSWDTEADGVIYFNTSDGEKIFYAVSKDGNSSSLGIARSNSVDYYFKIDAQDSTPDKPKSNLWIQMGANSGQGMYLQLVNSTTPNLKIDKLNVMSFEAAQQTIEAIDNAIQMVSTFRGMFGAQQNRLEHSVLANATSAENLQNSEAKIRDTDMAEEMTRFSKENILMQAGQSMLAQANQSKQGILALLQ